MSKRELNKDLGINALITMNMAKKGKISQSLGIRKRSERCFIHSTISDMRLDFLNQDIKMGGFATSQFYK